MVLPKIKPTPQLWKVKVKVTQSCLTLRIHTIHGIFQARILEWVAHSLLQGIFLTQGSNPGLPHCRQIPYQLSYQGISYVYTSTPSLLAFPPAPPPHYLLGHHRALSWASCAVQQLPASSLFYTWWCVCKCVSGTISFCHTLFSPSCVHKAVLCLCFYSCPASSFISNWGPSIEAGFWSLRLC